MRPATAPYAGPKARSCPFHVGMTMTGDGVTSGYRGGLVDTCAGCDLAARAASGSRRTGRPTLPYAGPKARSCPFHVGTTVGAGTWDGAARSRTGYRQVYASGACVGCTLAFSHMQTTRLNARHAALTPWVVDAAVIGQRSDALTRAEREEAVRRLDRGGQRSARDIATILGCHPRTVTRARKRMGYVGQRRSAWT